METHLLQDLAIMMIIAAAMTILCHRLHQPAVIGYLTAGILLGPYTPSFSLVSNLKSIHTLAELGLVFLMFSLGLEFNLPKIRKVGLSAGVAAVLEVGGMFAIGYLLGRWFGWSPIDSLFLGAILSISSTTIIVKVFMDFKMSQEKFVQVVFGILVLEDIVAIAILSILSGLGVQGGPDASAIARSILRIGLFVVVFLVVGLFFIPKFIGWVARFKVNEVLGIVTLALCLGGSYLASYFQLSIALGAFLTGAILAASDEIHQIEEWIHPIRDMFSAIFFISAGMLIQPALLWEYKGAIAIITAVTLIGKIVSGTAGSFLVGYDLKTSARIGMSLAQIGEFSFVIASLGLSLKVTSEFLYPLAVMVSSLTTFATPFLIRNSDRVVESLLRITPTPVRLSLDSYQAWLNKKQTARSQSAATAIFSKYLIRLGVYAALLVAFLMFTQVLSIALNKSILIWLISAILCLPLFLAIAKYSNHIILLLVTMNKHLLHFLNIHLFYNVLNIITVFFLCAIFMRLAFLSLREFQMLLIVTGEWVVVGSLFKRRTKRAVEWLESGLDLITGLATSEPNRQAILASGGTLLLVDITDQVTLPLASNACNKSIRSLGIREQTGASIVAIYRAGKHIANPMPDTELLADDVLILIGSEDELSKAKSILLTV